MNTQEKVEAVQDYIARAPATLSHHRLLRIKYTDGVSFVTETLGAFWLIDMIASHQTKPKVATAPFQVWRLTHEGGRWFVRCWNDTPEASDRLAVQGFPYSDFPEELLPFDMWVEDGVLLLPAEH